MLQINANLAEALVANDTTPLRETYLLWCDARRRYDAMLSADPCDASGDARVGEALQQLFQAQAAFARALRDYSSGNHVVH
jgi:hypothetical protein